MFKSPLEENGGIRLNKRDRIAAVVLICIGLFITIESLKLPLGEFRQPGAGFMPLVLGVIMLGLALAYLFISWHRTEEPDSPWGRRELKRPVLASIGVFVYALFLSKVGFPVMTALFMLYWLKVIEFENWRKSILIALLTTVGLYLIFVYALRIALPAGTLFRIGG